MSNLEKRLWDSDDSSPLTHEAAREIERLNWTISSLRSRSEAAEAECGRLRLVVEFLTDQVSRRLREPDTYDNIRINDAPKKDEP